MKISHKCILDIPMKKTVQTMPECSDLLHKGSLLSALESEGGHRVVVLQVVHMPLCTLYNVHM